MCDQENRGCQVVDEDEAVKKGDEAVAAGQLNCREWSNAANAVSKAIATASVAWRRRGVGICSAGRVNDSGNLGWTNVVLSFELSEGSRHVPWRAKSLPADGHFFGQEQSIGKLSSTIPRSR